MVLFTTAYLMLMFVIVHRAARRIVMLFVFMGFCIAGAVLTKSVAGVRRAKAALSSGCKSHPAIAPAGSNRSSYGGNEMAEAFG
jgi:hypothetical protein